MAIYAIALGCYIALMLLVISMEEGGDNLTTGTNGLTQALVLLSEGSGFKTDSLTLTIIPLLLTVLLIWLIATVVARLRATSPHAYASGLIVWLAITEIFRRSVSVGLVDDPWLVLLKAAIVFTFGYAFAALPGSAKVGVLRDRLRSMTSVRVRRCVKNGITIAALMLGLYLIIGLITVMVWTVRNHAAVVSVFDMTGMETGSRILTSLAMLIWLPNVMLWAISWLFGAGFVIGDLASFTLWVGQSNGLPPVPAFGILPEAVSDDLWRIVLVNLPFALAILIGLLALFLPQGFRYRPGNIRKASTRMSVVLDLAYPAGSFCLSAVLVSLGSTMMFSLANGSLGDHRLADVGVNVMVSTRAVGHPTALGLAAAWLIALIGTALVFSIGWVAERIKASRTTEIPADDSAIDNKPRRHTGSRGSQRIAGSPRSSGSRQSRSQSTQSQSTQSQSTQSQSTQSQSQQHKEQQDDKHEPSDTSSTGFRFS
jgi:hypothetical protein